jgi:hypothetical protein
MSDLGLLSSVHSNFEDYATLIDDVIMELQAGNSGGCAAKRLKRLIEAASNVDEDNANLRAAVFVSLLSGAPEITQAELATIATGIENGDCGDHALLKKLNRIAAHLERERASLAQRIGR